MEFIRYLLSSTALLSISYLVFRLVYFNGARFRQQRVFLIIIILFSLAFPLTGLRIEIPVLSGQTETGTTEKAIVKEVNPAVTGFTVGQMEFQIKEGTIVTIYIIICILLVSVIAVNFLGILKSYHLSEKEKYGRFIILRNKGIENPYSFFRWIFIPGSISDREEMESIIIHEGIHVSQYHSADKLLIGLISALMWFNPLVWMMKRSFNLIHEYLADEGTISNGVDRFRYQAFLINRVAEERLFLLSSSFNQSLIKKRMIMMTKDKSSKQWKGRILMLIPLSAVLLSATAFINGFFPEKAIYLPETVYIPATGVSGAVSVPDTRKQDTVRDKKVIVWQSAGKKGDASDRKEIKVTGYANWTGKDSMIYVIDGNQVKDISIINPDSIESVNVMKDDNLIIIRTKKPSDKRSVIKISDSSTGGGQDKVLYIIDGNESDDKAVIEMIDPSDIESVSVLKGDENIRKAGKIGYDGIIIVKTKKK
jgi:hypothetical protein